MMSPRVEHLTRKDWTLLVISAAGGKSLTPAQLQKSLFLVGEGFPAAVKPDFYEFQPYDFGPFSAAIYHDADLLASEGHVARQQVPGKRWSEYMATREGLGEASELGKAVSPEVLDYIRKVVKWAQSVSFQQLIRTIYAMFPAYKVRSVFRDDK